MPDFLSIKRKENDINPLCFYQITWRGQNDYDMHYTESQTKLHTFVFLFSVSMLIVLISHGDYLATGVYRTLMSGWFKTIIVEYFDPMSLWNFITSISCIGILKTGLSLNDFLYTLLM